MTNAEKTISYVSPVSWQLFRANWDELTIAMGLPETLRTWGLDALLDEYTKPNRHYHNINHILRATWVAGELCQKSNVKVWETQAVEYALFWHDFIQGHDLGKGRAETTSALIAESLIYYLPYGHVVQNAIIATLDHQTSTTSIVNKIVVDADLEILAADRETFDSYDSIVRLEYPHVSDDDWILGRGKFLVEFLKRENIYQSPVGREAYEAKARANLVRILKQRYTPEYLNDTQIGLEKESA